MLKQITQPHHQVALAKCQQSHFYKEAEEKIMKEIEVTESVLILIFGLNYYQNCFPTDLNYSRFHKSIRFNLDVYSDGLYFLPVLKYSRQTTADRSCNQCGPQHKIFSSAT